MDWRANWIGLRSVLRPRQHSIGYMGDGFGGLNTKSVLSIYAVTR